MEYITAQQSTAYEITDPGAITIPDVKEMAKSFSDGPNYYIRDKRSLCPSEVLTLFARYIQGKHLSPELLYGPERDYASQTSGEIEAGILANAVLEQYSTVLGFKQLPDYYQIGDNRINPVDMFCTLKMAIEMNLSREDMIEPSIGKGRLVCMDHINNTNDWGKSWVVFPENIDVSNILRLAQLQTWTLKPALY
ncbi:MAG: hypothetical protein GX815_02455 [Clostridiales bacterium]|nr:hypothetical protein [Clostridiales bacterium]